MHLFRPGPGRWQLGSASRCRGYCGICEKPGTGTSCLSELGPAAQIPVPRGRHGVPSSACVCVCVLRVKCLTSPGPHLRFSSDGGLWGEEAMGVAVTPMQLCEPFRVYGVGLCRLNGVLGLTLCECHGQYAGCRNAWSRDRFGFSPVALGRWVCHVITW